MALRGLMSLVFVFSITGSVDAGPGDWTHYGHVAARHCIAVDGPNKIDANTLAWIASEDPQDPNYDVEFEGATGPVVYKGKVYGYAKYYDEQGVYTNSQIIAYDANSGQIQWATAIDKAIYDSWSTPCIDTKHNTVLMGSGDKVFALDAGSGTEKWATQLEKAVVNASVCVAVDIPHARAFITDYDGFGVTGILYCINLDANEPNNSYEPGEIVWSDIIGGTGGNSPAYKDEVVYVASVKGTDSNTGAIYAYDATATVANKLWQVTSEDFGDFFGGVTVTKDDFLYAADCNFYGEEDNSVLCKIDCNDGSLVWVGQVERTDSIPIVVGDKIYISGGLEGFGSRAKVEAYQDLGTAVIKLWQTPASMVVGGWTNQPVYANGKLYVGGIASDGDYFGAYTDLYIFDITTTPDDPNFIISHYSGCGNSPAVTHDSIYSIGPEGLHKFYQPALLADINKDGEVDIYDLGELVDGWLYDGAVGVERCDLDLDGDVDFIDFSLQANQWCRQLN